MRPGKGMFKVFSLVTVLTIMLAFLPANVSAHSIDLSGVSRFGDKVAQIARDTGKTLSELTVNLATGNAQTTTAKTTNTTTIPTTTATTGITTKTTTTIPTTLPPTTNIEAIQKLTADAAPDKDNKIMSPSGKITLTIPKGAVSTTSQIEFDEYDPQPSSGMVMLNRFELIAKDKATGAAFSKFNQNLQISIQHDPKDLAGVDPQSVRLYYQDDKTKQWLPVASSKFDPKTNTLTGTTDHFTNYGEQANSLSAGPGRIMASQVIPQTGAFTFNYPIELPPGQGGFQPKLALNYNSGLVDEMKNKQAVGSWVGIGWDMNFGKITYDITSNKYYLDFTGGSYELFSTDGTNFFTNPESYYKISYTFASQTWVVLDKKGNYYQFGGTTDSAQYYDINSDDNSPNEGQPELFYRWDLSLMKDVNNNQATITYTQYSPGSIRAAYPNHLHYGSNDVYFNFTADPVNLRQDDPTNGPNRMDIAYLNNIQIKTSNNLIRQYNFNYNWTPRVHSTDYGGIYYAGTMTLASVQQAGTIGGVLPEMDFTYQNKELYRHSATDEYVGNPGNPAVLSWPYLTRIQSGYGGETDITYTQKPLDTALDMWTRQVVTCKSVNSGIGPIETTTYNYINEAVGNDNPEYAGNTWTQSFLGFDQVKETDSANNSIKHWYYTKNNVDGKDAYSLKGKEYKTQWLDSSNNLLKEQDYGWEANSTATNYGLMFQNVNYGSRNVAASNDGYVYIADNTTVSGPNGAITIGMINKYDKWGNFILSWQVYANPTGIEVDANGNVYVVDNGGIYEYSNSGTFIRQYSGKDIAFDSTGNIYTITDYSEYEVWHGDEEDTVDVPPALSKLNPDGNMSNQVNLSSSAESITIANGNIYILFGPSSIQKFSTALVAQGTWGTYGSGDGKIFNAFEIVGGTDCIYVADSTNRIQKFSLPGNQFVQKWIISYVGYSTIQDFCITPDSRFVTILKWPNMGNIVEQLGSNWAVQLNSVKETTYKPGDINTYKTSQTRYSYDSYGNVVTEYDDGDTSTAADDSTIWRIYNANTTANILDKPYRERVYSSAKTSDGRVNQSDKGNRLLL